MQESALLEGVDGGVILRNASQLHAQPYPGCARSVAVGELTQGLHRFAMLTTPEEDPAAMCEQVGGGWRLFTRRLPSASTC